MAARHRGGGRRRPRDSRRDGGAMPDRHKSVSFRALRRNSSRSSSLPRGMVMPSARAGVGRFFHERTTYTTKEMPNASAAKGMIQATRLKPVGVGAGITVGP